MYQDLPKYLRRDLRRVHGRLHQPTVHPLTMNMMIAVVDTALGSFDAVVLDGWQWRSCSSMGARSTILAVRHRLPVDGHYYRRGDLLVFSKATA